MTVFKQESLKNKMSTSGGQQQPIIRAEPGRLSGRGSSLIRRYSMKLKPSLFPDISRAPLPSPAPSRRANVSGGAQASNATNNANLKRRFIDLYQVKSILTHIRPISKYK